MTFLFNGLNLSVQVSFHGCEHHGHWEQHTIIISGSGWEKGFNYVTQRFFTTIKCHSFKKMKLITHFGKKFKRVLSQLGNSIRKPFEMGPLKMACVARSFIGMFFSLVQFSFLSNSQWHQFLLIAELCSSVSRNVITYGLRLSITH